jgi:hypothetical protein
MKIPNNSVHPSLKRKRLLSELQKHMTAAVIYFEGLQEEVKIIRHSKQQTGTSPFYGTVTIR